MSLLLVLKLAFENETEVLSWLKQFEKSGVNTVSSEEVSNEGQQFFIPHLSG